VIIRAFLYIAKEYIHEWFLPKHDREYIDASNE